MSDEIMMTRSMKKIALLAGMGPESTVDYYRGIIDAFKSSYDKTGYPEILIDSLNLKRLLELKEKGGWGDLADELAKHFEALKAAGAEIGAMASNTPHKMFKEIQAHTSLPLISIVEATREVAVKQNASRLLLLGTKFTMSSDFYSKSFAQAGISLVVPDNVDQNFINDKIYSEIEHGLVKDATKKEFVEIMRRCKIDALDGVILGCTELPLILKEADIDGCCLNTAHIHIAAIVQACREEVRLT